MAGVFINYRTGDGHQLAAALNRELRRKFGDDRVFLDSTSLPPGRPFPPELERRLIESNVLLVLIGPNWLTVRNEAGERRIDEPTDYVAYEIRRSLERQILVLPVLLDDTPRPDARQLPSDIAVLVSHQECNLRSRHLDRDLAELVRILSGHVPGASGADAARPEPPRRKDPVATKIKVGRGIVQGDHSSATYNEGREP
ncbi:toll/interleukin-1 receptor domain-containing protein [Micromonospora sp. A3M-1-15]|uniref:toll/interleukin-1 receptor domain-containing protein n=1 Tax=Micromonospora sp. A3M-1-15 TaxID=2962035 RepID=UPI0020B8E5E8|nr:toll/interleukin-1 receptor domain-containing protein [Micromonospora sp. A3M-1-15]MCP3785307.1 toll/interleukin-1 receptor domain-containing protein [Micromonospora sp. A3M-1-15]